MYAPTIILLLCSSLIHALPLTDRSTSNLAITMYPKNDPHCHSPGNADYKPLNYNQVYHNIGFDAYAFSIFRDMEAGESLHFGEYRNGDWRGARVVWIADGVKKGCHVLPSGLYANSFKLQKS